MKKLLLLLAMVATFSLSVIAQTRTVTGVVTSEEDGEPLAGASVVPVGGHGQGTATDLDGRFTLQIPSNVTKLRVSYVGMKTATVDITSNKLDIVLESAGTNLDEVMVVAYGTAKKSAFTGSATVIDADAIEKTQVTNVLNALTGKVAGVQINTASGQPGATTPSIYIRGISSLNAGNAPLIVVNGTPYPGDVNNLNPNDIESMTVLKDAASNALYGARGANGVILITTKKAPKGGNATVTVDAKWGSNMRATREYNTIQDPRQYYEVYYQYLRNYALSQGQTAAGAHLWANSQITSSSNYGLAYLTYSVPEGQSLIGFDGTFNPNATPGNLVSYQGEQYLLTPDSWLDAAYKHGLRQEYNVGIANGSENTQFYASVSYLGNEGITVNSYYDRFTGRLNAESQIKPWLKVGGDLSYTHYRGSELDADGSSNSSANMFAASTEIAPIYPLFIRNGQGEILKNNEGLVRYDYGNTENAGLVRPVFPGSNAINSAQLDTGKYRGNAFTGQGYIEVRFLKDFRFTSNNAVTYDGTISTGITNPFFGSYKASNGIISKSNGARTTYTFQQLLNWHHTFGVNDVEVLAGHENYWNKYSYLYASKSNMFDPWGTELDGAITDGSMSSYSSAYNNEGWLFRAQYNYNEKYFASASFRRDASSRFAPNHRWGNFWSLGGAWIISKEDFFHADWVNLLKIKASYGEQGNDNIGNFLYTDTYTLVNGGGYPAAVPNTKGNPNITWEKNGNLNYGVEFDLFNSRLTGSIEGFYRKTSDMLAWFTLPPSLGWTGYWDNIGDMTNKGIEIDLTGIILQERDITWSVNANFTYYKNKLAYLPEQRKTMTIDDVSGYSSGNFFYGEGIPLYTYRFISYAGVNPENGQALYWHRILDADGADTGEREAVPYTGLNLQGAVNDYFLCGSTLPKIYGGFGTSFQCYGFDLSLDFTYSLGGKIYDAAYASYMTSPNTSQRGSNFHADILKAWTPENTNTDVPIMLFNDNYAATTSDRFLTSANYLNLQTVNCGYSFPEKLVKKMQLSKLRIYFQCDNVFYWSKRKGMDPRQSITGTMSNTFYSPIRTISGGINVVF